MRTVHRRAATQVRQNERMPGTDGSPSGLFEPGEPVSDAAIDPLRPPDPKDGYSLLIEGAGEYAVFMLSPAGVVSSWNLGAQRMKGYRPEEVIGQHFSVFYLPDDRAAGVPNGLLARALSEGRAETDGWRQRRDGSRFWASVMISPLRDEAGRLRGFAKLTRDETGRRAASLLHERAALMGEQERIASELAGTVVRRLFSVGLGLNGILQMVGPRQDLTKRVEAVSAEVDETIKYLRTAVFDIDRAGRDAEPPLPGTL